MGAMTLSATLGGDLYIDGRYVRIIPFNSGSGNVPAAGTSITQGGASGKLIGVYQDLASAPTTAGSSMPTSGFVKIRQWNSVAYTSGALTGVTANATGADRVGWIEVVGQEATLLTVNGLSNQNQKLVLGLPFLIGTTPSTPSRSDTYQIPSNGNTVFMPGVFVENTPNAGDWEFWPTTSDSALITKVGTDTYRGRYCWVDSSGVLRFGNDGTNSTGGTLPAANCRIVMGNVILNSATAAARTVNSMNATPNSRYRWSMGGLANLEVEWCTHNWRITTNIAKRTNVANSGIFGPVSIQQSGEQVIWTDSGIGTQLSESVILFDLVTCALGGIFTNVTFGKGAFPATNLQPFRSNASDNIILDRCRFTHTGDKFSTSNYGISFTSSSNVEVKDCVIGSNINTSTGSNYHFHDNKYYFSAYGLPGQALNAVTGLNIATISNFMIEDESFPLQYQVPGSALVNISTNSADGTVRNIGSYSSPIDASAYTEQNASYSRSGTTVTVTTASPHNLRVNDSIVSYIGDSSGVANSTRTVTAVPTSNTFTFTGTNSGATSGVISFYTGYMGAVATIGGNNVARIKFQNIWVVGHTAQPLTINATTNDVIFDNVNSDYRYVAHPNIVGTDIRFRSFGLNTTAPAAQTGVLGTLMESVFTTPLSATNKTGVSWTRASAVVTVTSANHNLTTGDYIQVYDTTNTTGAANGFRSITALDTNTFTISGANTGTTSGTLSYRISDSRLNIFMNDKSPTQPYVTIDSGTPKFTGAGTLSALNIGDGVTWETPDWVYAFDNFVNVFPNIASSTSVQQHFNMYYALDRGSGYSSFKNLYYQRSGASGSSGTATVTVTDVTGVTVNDYVYGTGIADSAQVQSINAGTNTLTLTINNVAAVSGTLIFTQAPAESQFPSTGVKIKIRILSFGAPTAAVTYISIPMTSTATTRQNLYPQETPETQTVTLSNGVTGSRVQIYDLTSNTELYNGVPASFPYTWTDPVPYVADREIRVRITYVNGTSAKKFVESVIGVSTNTDPALSYRINQEDDEVYNANGVDGSTVTNISIDDSTFKININTGSITWADIYAYEMYYLFTSVGIQDLGQTIEAIDQANYKVDHTMLIKNTTTSPTIPLVISGGWGVDANTGQSIDLVDTTGGTIFNAPDHIVPFSTSSGVITGDVTDVITAIDALNDLSSADITAAVPSATDTAQEVWSDSATYAIGEKGRIIIDTEANTDVMQAKVDQL